MREFIKKILEINTNICENIEKFDASERGLLSQNILAQLRNLIEHIDLYFYAKNQNIPYIYESIKQAIEYVKTKGNLNVLTKFHKFLQISASHYTLDKENSERLMLKYYEYLLKIKKLMKSENIDVLENLEDFPLNTDQMLQQYYQLYYKYHNHLHQVCLEQLLM